MRLASCIIMFFLICDFNLVFAGKWEDSLELSVTRCFKRKNVTIQCNDFSENNLKTAQELEIIAIDYYGMKRSYGYGKAIDGNLCQIHLKKIRKLIRSVDQVCIAGDDEDLIEVNETFSRWRALETSKGKANF